MPPRHNRYAPVIASLGALLLSAPLLAGDAKTSSENEMQMMDSDKDGKLSATEHATGAETDVRDDGRQPGPAGDR